MEFLELLSEIEFKEPSEKDRSLDDQSVRKFIDYNERKWHGKPHGDEVIELLNEIIDKTIYIDFVIFWDNLLRSWDMFKLYVGDKPFYLIVDGNKIGSETWIIQGLANEILENTNCQGILKSNDIQNDEVYNSKIFVTIDDCIYTGIHTYVDVFGVFAEQTIDAGYDISEFTAIAITPYYSWDGTESCSQALKDTGYAEFKHFGVERIDPIRIANTDPPTQEKPFLAEYDFQFEILYPIYFDHKVGGSSSSFPSIYLNAPTGMLLKNPPDRSPIENLKIELKKSNLKF